MTLKPHRPQILQLPLPRRTEGLWDLLHSHIFFGLFAVVRLIVQFACKHGFDDSALHVAGFAGVGELEQKVKHSVLVFDAFSPLKLAV